MQSHGTSHLHYDLRLEMGGVLKSWAVPRGPTMDPDVRRLAVQTEDHPVDYLTFEGRIPDGAPGAGEVMVWDLGTYTVPDDRPPLLELEHGRLKFRLKGQKLNGEFVLARMEGEGGESKQWVLKKVRDGAEVFGFSAEQHPGSVLRPLPPVEGGEAPSRVVELPLSARLRPVFTPRVAESASLNPADVPGAVARRHFPEIEPMVATAADAPFSAPHWLFELQWEGARVLVYLDRGETRLAGRGGEDVTGQFPELQGLAAGLREAGIAADRALLDGEIVALDEAGHSSLRRLQQRLVPAGANGMAARSAAAPVTLMVFDLLYLNGYNLLDAPLVERKRLLQAMVPEAMQESLRYSDHLAVEGEHLFELARRRGLEGIVAKQADSPYVAGPSRLWLKIRTAPRQEAVIVGYTLPKTATGGFASLLVAVYRPETRRYHLVGQVNAGLNAATRRLLLARMAAAPRATAEGLTARAGQRVQWVEPRLVAEIGFSGWTRPGRLRQPVYLGLCPDMTPQECVREKPLHPAAS